MAIDGIKRTVYLLLRSTDFFRVLPRSDYPLRQQSGDNILKFIGHALASLLTISRSFLIELSNADDLARIGILTSLSVELE